MKKKSKPFFKKDQISCFIIFLLVTLTVILFSYAEMMRWDGLLPLGTERVLFFTLILLCLLQSANLLLCLFFRFITIEKKLLIMIGSMAISFSLLGYFAFVINHNITFLDALYRSIQLFVGEFDTSAFGDAKIPLLINLARFLALFVTFGTIVIIILRQRIYHLNLKLLYKDIVIIADKPDQYIKDLAENFTRSKRKVIIGYTDDSLSVDQEISSGIPMIPVSLSKNTLSQLKICNIRNAKCIYLFCDHAKDNILLLKSIYQLLKPYGKNPVKSAAADPSAPLTDADTINNLIKEYCRTVFPDESAAEIQAEYSLPDEKVFYIRYSSDEEREYYSLDEVFTHRSSAFTTYFINVFDISIRQMIALNSLVKNLKIDHTVSLSELKDKLEHIVIAVSGSGDVLYRTINEIAKNCLYNDQPSINIIYLKTKKSSSIDYSKMSPYLNEIVSIEEIDISDFEKRKAQISLLFISCPEELEIMSLLKEIFQYDLHTVISEYMILTDGDLIEYSILETYLESLLSPYHSGIRKFADHTFHPVIHLSRTKNLIFSIDHFYQQYGPSSHDVHLAYQKAFTNKILSDFNRLPEIFIESSLLSSLHHEFIIETINRIILLKTAEYDDTGKDEFYDEIRSYFEFLAITEHERWFNERLMQGCIYGEEQSYIYHKNSQLLHWNHLTKEQQESNTKYVINAIIMQTRKSIATKAMSPLKENLIKEYDFKASNIIKEEKP
ncbi:MAG: hypothetical protein JXQ23_07320 [Clostridia bacterium]|nr:hypothetical protein [Clostridia bacterium]